MSETPQKHPQPDFSVLLFWHADRFAEATLLSLKQQESSPSLQLLILNASSQSDEALDAQAAAVTDDRQVIPAPGSFTEALQTALPLIRGRLVFVTTPDVAYHEEALAQVLATADEQPQWPMIYLPEARFRLRYGQLYTPSASRLRTEGCFFPAAVFDAFVRQLPESACLECLGTDMARAQGSFALCRRASFRFVHATTLSVVVHADNPEQTDRLIASMGAPQSTIQLLITDPSADENEPIDLANATRFPAMAAWRAAYPQGISRLETPDLSQEAAANRALPLITGEFVMFLAGSSLLQKGAMENLLKAIKTDYSRLYTFMPVQDTEMRHQKYTYALPASQVGPHNLRRSPKSLQLMLQAYAIDSTLLTQRRFKEEWGHDSSRDMMLWLLWRAGHFMQLADTLFYRVPQEDDTSAFMGQHQPEWYFRFLQDSLLPLLKKESSSVRGVPTYLKKIAAISVYVPINCNLNERTKNVLSGERLQQFFALCGEVLAYLPLSDLHDLLPKSARYVRLFIGRLRAAAMGHSLRLVDAGGAFSLCEVAGTSDSTTDWAAKIPFLAPGEEPINGELVPLKKSTREFLDIQAMNYDQGELSIDATLAAHDYLPTEEISLTATCGPTPFAILPTETYYRHTCFGVLIAWRTVYHLSVPLADRPQPMGLSFYLEIHGHPLAQVPHFCTMYARFPNIPGVHPYWAYTKHGVMTWDGNQLAVQPLSGAQHVKRECSYMLRLFAHGCMTHLKRETHSAIFRLLYWITKPFFAKKRIWITYDKLYKAGDNGEYIYQYIRRNSREIRPYYIIKPDALDYPRMKKERGHHLLLHQTLRNRLTVLHAEAVLTTHANVVSYCGFTDIYPFFGDLFVQKIICIQHGLTIQQIAQFQNRLFDNISLYACASPYEITNLTQPIYGYLDPTRLRMTGLARYDGLVNRDQKEILITPTWRRDIVNSAVAHVKKSHSDFFRQSEYFRLYDHLIHDERLIECARRCGYGITYLLHPGVSAQIDDFDNTGYVKVVAAYGDVCYEKILTESSLMVTDYSGVQFDFAYMRKPILYYHPKTLPPHYEEGCGFLYDSMGFGPVIDEHEVLVDQLCTYMENGCRTQLAYIQRADSFFAFADHQNCQRIYQEVKTFLDGRR